MSKKENSSRFKDLYLQPVTHGSMILHHYLKIHDSSILGILGTLNFTSYYFISLDI